MLVVSRRGRTCQKTADISRLPHEIMSRKRAQKFYADDVSPSISGQSVRLVEATFSSTIRGTTQIWVVTLHQSGISAL